jgi:hypothetical protein
MNRPKIKNCGARRGTRTPTPLLASGPKPGASTNFAILAGFCAEPKTKGDHEVKKRVALRCLCRWLFNFNRTFYWNFLLFASVFDRKLLFAKHGEWCAGLHRVKSASAERLTVSCLKLIITRLMPVSEP